MMNASKKNISLIFAATMSVFGTTLKVYNTGRVLSVASEPFQRSF